MADVRLALEGAFETAVAQTATSVPVVARGRAREYLAWGLATVATLLAVGASVLYLRAPRQTDTIVRFTVPPPAGAVRPAGAGFAVSPDSQLLAFVAKGADGVSRIFVRHLDAAEAQPLAGTDRAGAPFWAPDGRSLGFVKEGGLYRVALDGSAPRLLCSVPGGLSGGTWSARGVIVFASRSGLLQVPDTGGTPTPVTTLDAGAKETSHTWPWFLPDGRRLLFLALADEQSRGTIWATAIDDPARTRIVESSGGAAYAAGWLLSTTATPRSLVAQPFDPEHLTLQGTPQPIRDRLSSANTLGFRGFAVSSSGVLVVDRPPPTVSQLVWMDRSGREVATVSPRASLPEFALASDERRVVARVTLPDGATRALWLFDGIRPEGTRLTYEGRPTRPMWALDGRHVYFTDTTGNEFALRTLAIGATAPTAFEQPGPFVHFEDVTRDGRYLVFKSLKAPDEVWIQRVGSAERRALVQGQFAASWPRVSPDSHWLAYTLESAVRPRGLRPTLRPAGRPDSGVGEGRLRACVARRRPGAVLRRAAGTDGGADDRARRRARRGHAAEALCDPHARRRDQSAPQLRSGGPRAEVPGQHDCRRQRQRPARSDAQLDDGAEEVAPRGTGRAWCRRSHPGACVLALAPHISNEESLAFIEKWLAFKSRNVYLSAPGARIGSRSSKVGRLCA